MKKIIKLLLTIPLITTPFCFSFSKKEPPKKQEKNDNENQKLKKNFINKEIGE